MKQKIVVAFLTGIITTSIISFTLLGVNRGFATGFVWVWLRSWAIACAEVVPVVLLISPLVQRLARLLLRERLPAAEAPLLPDAGIEKT
ncbi:DUF2798 domain-containing protein [Hymenobacter sp. 15J16-1T3B]|uniref:DUF2798 domain-containing protein n=1 Tax=Hymenobacter sp. 15J16-1T3B TaxID=2886941 RepID=UPI001D10C558|nr:DUF2798 domain-containing protein [Hymenobacter sp. 15J16-1T3B]MCC3158692.1 DUF2798 domain-containing protein [Hymenobacter sp. 15J16-1T3B]